MNYEKEKSKYEKRYEEQMRELLVLTGEYVGGAGSVAEGLWSPNADILGYVNLETGETVESEGYLSWLAHEKDKDGWIYHLKDLTIYHIKCRKIKPEKVMKNAQPRFFNNFMLTEVVEREVENPALLKLLEKYKEVVVIEDGDCGTFTLERHFNWFAGTVDWLGEDCHVTLECDEENGTTADQALAQFRKIYANFKEWDQKFRAFAAEKLAENANDWQDEGYDDEDGEDLAAITEESFAGRIVISEFSIDAEGDYEAYYDDDNMFWGHVIIVSGSVNGGMEDAYIAGQILFESMYQRGFTYSDFSGSFINQEMTWYRFVFYAERK